MKCRMILPVGLLTCVVCFGGVKASAFELFRMVGEQAAVEAPPPVAEPAPMEEEGGKFEAQQKGCGEAVCEPCCRPTPLRDCGARIRCATMNLHCRIGAFGESLKARLCVPQFCGPEVCCEPACGVETKGEVVSQKDCGPVSQKGCEPFALPCRPRLWGWGRTCCEPACGVESTVQKGCCSGVEQKEFDMSKDSEVQKEARK